MFGGVDEAHLQRRVGTTVGWATVLALAAYPFLMVDPTEAGRLAPIPYGVIVAVGSLAALVVPSRPVLRALPPRHRPLAAYTWSAVLLATVTGAIAFSGGSTSELHHLLALPLVFAAMAYPRRVLVALLGLTVVLVALMQVVTSSPFLPARTAARIATVGGSVVVTSWLTAAHTRQLHRARHARDEADRQAATLDALARAAADVNDLDHEAVLAATVATAARIGYDGAAFLVLRHGGVVTAEHVGALTPDRVAGLVSEDELRGCLADGTAHTSAADGVALLCVPVVVGDRAIGALVGVVDEADATVDRDGAGLRMLAAQATTALTNAHRFRSTRELVDQLRDVERLRHDLVSTASHELRTPTTVIKAAAELLDSRWADLPDHQRREFIKRINVHADALGHVLDQVARFVDLEADATRPIERAALDLAELVQACITRNRADLGERTVITRLAPVTVTADAESLGRAIDALLDNVATHTPGDATVHIVTQQTEDGASLLVADDGVGVPAESLSTLLDPFARSGDVLTRGTRGVGLGLTLVDQTVRAHGGRVVLTTDDGFSVRLHLPQAMGATTFGTAPAPPAGPPAAAAPGPSSPSEDSTRPLVLVVEDDANLRELATLTLEDAGCRVLAAADGRSAVTLAGSERPDVVVLDVDLPGLDGREVAQVLRDDPATAAVPIVVATGSADRRELWTIWASGADALLVKPYEVEALAETVLDLANHHNGDTGTAATTTDNSLAEDTTAGRRERGRCGSA